MRQAMTWEVTPALGRQAGGVGQKALLGGGFGLVPLLAATGLALPLPAQVYQLAEFLVERTAAIAQVLPGVEEPAAPTPAAEPETKRPAARTGTAGRIASARRVEPVRPRALRARVSHAHSVQVRAPGTQPSVTVPTRSRSPEELATPEPASSASPRGGSRTDHSTTQPATTAVASAAPTAVSSTDARPTQPEPVAPAPTPKDPPVPAPEPTQTTVTATATVSATTSPTSPTQTGVAATASASVSAGPVSTTVTVGIGPKP
jgi:hypothetical protein